MKLSGGTRLIEGIIHAEIVGEVKTTSVDASLEMDDAALKGTGIEVASGPA